MTTLVASAPRAAALLKIAETPAEFEAYRRIRREVFVKEQGLFPCDDTDGRDACAIPIVAIVAGEVVGVVRCYHKRGGVWFGGRLAVAREHRTGTVGARLVRRAVEVMEARPDVSRFFATVQVQNVRFFERLGWQPRGRLFQLEGCLHQLMEYPLRSHRP